MVKSHPKYLQQAQKNYWALVSQILSFLTKSPCFSYIHVYHKCVRIWNTLPLRGIPIYNVTSRCSKEHKSLLVGCVQKLGMLAMKNYNIRTLQLPSLSNRRLFLKLCTIFKVVHGMCYFPPPTCNFYQEYQD